MVQVHCSRHEYNHPYETATAALFQKYSITNNPFSRHVESCDIVRADLEARGPDKRQVMIVERLIHKIGSLPTILKPFLGNITQSFILETSVVDPANKRMQSWTRNIDHRRIIYVEEVATFQGVGDHTIVETNVKFRSGLRFGLRNRIESISHQQFTMRLPSSRQGMAFVMENLLKARQSITGSPNH